MEQQELRLACYRDEEIPAAIGELFSYPEFLDGMNAFLPPALIELILREKESIHTVRDFQAKLISPFLKFIQQISMSALTVGGLDRLDPKERYLFISNHRDIVLDSAFLNLVLFDHGFTTSQIAIGDNLMKHRISELLFRINKSFVVKRTGSPRELYDYSVRLSEYIRDVVTKKIDSVWIAQREGRAKDGDDRTQIGVLKMLSLSGEKDLKKHFQELRIVPVSISYEVDPCDLLKTREFLQKKTDPTYKKSFQQDLAYILQGLKGQKGEVHFQFGAPLTEELEVFDTAPAAKKQLELLVTLIDKAIHRQYRLHPVNYVACDLLTGTSTCAGHYSPEEKERCRQFFATRVNELNQEDQEAGQEYLLRIYANPVMNAAVDKSEVGNGKSEK